MNKKFVALILCTCVFAGSPTYASSENSGSAANAPQIVSTSRLAGYTRYETAKVISECYGGEKVKNVILSTGKGFADALSASVLAHQKEAPILLADSSVDNSKDAFAYVIQHLDSTGTVYIIGGEGIIGPEFETKLNSLGFRNVVRIAGFDRFDTSYKLAGALNDLKVSTVVITSGKDYPDALSISSLAANKGWPILLSPDDTLPQEIINFLAEKKPSQVYIAGGEGVISDNIKLQIGNLIPQADVERLTGQNRFDTNANIAETFAPNPSVVYLTTGYDFADAIAGSALAAKNGDPIIMVDPSVPTLPKPVASYFAKLSANNSYPKLVTFGGSGVISDEIVKNSTDLISGAVKETSIYSIDDIGAVVTQYDRYSLPITVQARLYNSEVMDLPVQWESTVVNTKSIGSTIYEGAVAGYGKTIKLNLTVQKPDLNTVMNSGLLAQYSTHFDSTQVNRTENLRLAAKALDGKLLAPGEPFSFNDSVGERTAEAGYKVAMIIEGDAYMPGLGGGVCQVSSTLYNAVLLADLEVLERHRHSLPVDYVPPGQDATVSFSVLDFRFRNNTDAYLLIRSSIENNTLTFRLYGKVK